jgi:excisionase family DNA binding protein
MLCTTEPHIDRLVYERKIPFVKVGGKVRFKLRDLDRWIETHRTEAAS